MVTKAHPGTQIYNIDGFDNMESVDNMWKQVDWFKQQMLPIFKNSTDGVNMICYSQGLGWDLLVYIIVVVNPINSEIWPG